MTADAKVGLLLGLVFIVMIAFLINGLPEFLQNASPDDMIDTRLVEAAQQLQVDIPLRSTELSQEEVVVLDDCTPSSSADPVPPVTIEEQSAPQVPPAPVAVVNVPAKPKAVQQNTSKSRVHVVKSGESLAAIAQKYYGKEEGNRLAAIQRLYEANRSVLESPDKVRAGDKLTIPLQNERQNTTPKPTAAVSPQRTLMDKFTGIFEQTKESGQPRVYVVQPGDSLWRIAQKTLNDGKRYQEILQLNRGVKTEDLVVGMSLKIPQK